MCRGARCISFICLRALPIAGCEQALVAVPPEFHNEALDRAVLNRAAVLQPEACLLWEARSNRYAVS